MKYWEHKILSNRSGYFLNDRPFFVLDGFADRTKINLTRFGFDDYTFALYQLHQTSKDPTWWKNYVLSPGSLLRGQVAFGYTPPSEVLFWYDFKDYANGFDLSANLTELPSRFGGYNLPNSAHASATVNAVVQEDATGLKYVDFGSTLTGKGWAADLGTSTLYSDQILFYVGLQNTDDAATSIGRINNIDDSLTIRFSSPSTGDVMRWGNQGHISDTGGIWKICVSVYDDQVNLRSWINEDVRNTSADLGTRVQNRKNSFLCNIDGSPQSVGGALYGSIIGGVSESDLNGLIEFVQSYPTENRIPYADEITHLSIVEYSGNL